MRVEELLQACCTPCDELLIKFKDEPKKEKYTKFFVIVIE